jgi:ABC-type transport system substrate-binding protein
MQGVTFQDGTKFNATAVQWNLYRLMHFLNWSDNSWLPAPWNRPLPATTAVTQQSILYLTTLNEPLIEEVEIIDEYTVKIILREVKASWISIMCWQGTFMMSPTYMLTLDDPTTATIIEAIDSYLEYIPYHPITNPVPHLLVGTGPFEFVSFAADVEVKFAPFADYKWGPTNLTSLTFVQIEDEVTRNNALLSGDIDILDSPESAYLDQFAADPEIEIVNAGSTQSILWTSFNYNSIPFAARKAISYSLNYSYVLDVIYDRLAVDLLSPIPQGILYSNYSYDAPFFDRAIARQTIIDADLYGAVTTHGLSMSSTDQDWIDVATGPTPLRTLNYTWNSESTDRGDIGNRLAFDMEYIGFELEIYSVAWGILIAMSRDEPWRLEMFTMGWAPDYFDPENFINPEWSNVSSMNGGEYYEPDVQALMDAGLIETDPVAREAIYQEIQQKMIERDMPAMWIRAYVNWDAWRDYVRGWVPNALMQVWSWPLYLV